MTIERASPVTAVTGVQPRAAGDRTMSDTAAKSGKRHPSHSEKPDVSPGIDVKLSGVQNVLQTPPADGVNKERIEALKAAIRNGELVMDTSKIADGLIRQAQDLLQGK